MDINRTVQHRILLLLVVILLCHAIFSVIYKQAPTVETTTRPIPLSSSSVLCYPPNGAAFKSDELTPLNILQTASQSVYVDENDASKGTYLSSNY